MYTDEIQKVRNEAYETNVANRIMDLLENLELTSNENSSRRWIWELIQNAKDVTNSTGKVDINISFDEDENIIKFEHNGRLFSTKNLVYLIEQVSTKDREELGELIQRATGKFGTGFLTTHLLSEKVDVSGILKDDTGNPRKFEIELDRSGKNKTDITNAIIESYKQLDNSQELPEDIVINENEFNTTFTYKLSNDGIEVARNGLDDLYDALPYVFAFVPQLSTLSVDTYDWHFKMVKATRIDDNLKIYKISFIEAKIERKIYICTIEKDEVSVAVEIANNEGIYIKEYPNKLPRIFCDFPLIGTEDFTFPVVINSSKFNPTEPRDGVFLSDIVSAKVDENKALIIEARDLYKKLIDYVSGKGWKNIFNIVNIRQQSEKIWLSRSWLKENIIDNCKDHILKTPIVDNVKSERKALYNWLDDPEVFIISDNNKDTREKVWDLASSIMPDMLTRRWEIHSWYNSLWDKCHNFSLKDLVKKIEDIKNIQSLSDYFLDDNETIKWLNDFYILISEDKRTTSYVLDEKIKIFPNQNGVFRSYNMLYKDSNIDKAYKDISTLIGHDCRNKLLHTEISLGDWITLEDYCQDDIFYEISDALHRNNDKADDIYKQIIVLHKATEKNTEQLKLIEFFDTVLPNCLSISIEVNEISEDLLEAAMKHLSTNVANEISSYQNIFALADCIKTEEPIEEWLADYIDYLVNNDYVNLLDKKTRPILPNQNGDFKIKDELFLDSGEIDEILKDLSRIAGNDIREELLVAKIYLKLPENRTKKIEDIAPDIISYIKANQGESKCQDHLMKEAFREFYIWLSENLDKAERYFSEVWKHKHWLFDDYEIAENMKKAEELEDILKRYNIQDTRGLEELLQKKQENDNKQILDEEIHLTEELLIQYGIYSEEALEKAMSSNIFGNNFIHESKHDYIKFEFVKRILERSKVEVIRFLKTLPEYDLSNMIELDNTIFMIKKHNQDMYLIIRPSDYKQVILYYGSEKDVLDYEKDWELWVEDGTSEPEKITFGKMLKLTGINKIPLKRIE